MRKSKLALAILALSVIQVQAAAKLDWTIPTTYADAVSTPIESGAKITYTVYDGATKLATGLTVNTYTDALATVGDCKLHKYTVTASISLESAKSNEVVIPFSCAPKPPTSLTATIQ